MIILCQIQSFVLTTILCTWVGIESLAKLDSAFCAKNLRKHFLHLLASPNFVHDTEENYSSNNYFSWLDIRSIKIKFFFLSGIFKGSKYLIGVLKSISFIQYLEISFCPLLIEIVDKYCSKIFDLNLLSSEGMDRSNVVYLFSKLQDIHSLKLPEAFNFILPPIPTLKKLYCHNMSDSLCNAFINLKVLSFCTIDTEVLKIITQKFTNIQKFEVKTICGITDKEFLELVDGCCHLNEVVLRSNKLTHFSAFQLVHKHHLTLTNLNLSRCSITNSTLVQIGLKCELLKYFACCYCSEISDSGIRAIIKQCRILSQLHFSYCTSIANTIVSDIACYCPQIESIACAGCTNIDDSLISDLIKMCSKLYSFDIKETKISMTKLLEFAYDCESIELNNSVDFHNYHALHKNLDLKEFCCHSHALRVRNCNFLNNLPSIASNIASLRIACYAEITNETLLFILSKCPKLTQLQVKDCPLISANILAQCTTSCPDIVKLEINRIADLTDDILIAFIGSHVTLSVLCVSGCSLLTDLAISEIGKKCKQLRQLEVGRLFRITDDSVHCIVKYCPHIFTLNLHGCYLLTDTTLENIQHHCQSLRKLIINECPGLSMRAVFKFAKKFVHLEEFKYDTM